MGGFVDRLSVEEQEFSVQIAKPDIKDWFFVLLGALSLIILVFTYVHAALTNKEWRMWFVLPGGAAILIALGRLPLFLASNLRLVVGKDTVSLWRGRHLEKSFSIQGSAIQGRLLWPALSGEPRLPIELPEEWVAGKPARLMAVWALLDRGAVLKSLLPPEEYSPENPRYIEVNPAGSVNADSAVFIAFSVVMAIWGFGAAMLQIVGIYALCMAVLTFWVGIYVHLRNRRPASDGTSQGYFVQGSALKLKLDPDSMVAADLSVHPIIITCSPGLTRPLIKVGFVNDAKELVDLTHWQERMTSDINRLLVMAWASGQRPMIELLESKP